MRQAAASTLSSVPHNQDTAWRDLTMSVADVLTFAQRWIPYLAAATLLPHVLIWGVPPFPDLAALPLFLAKALLYLGLGLLIYAVSAVIHEGFHVVGMMLFADSSWRSIRYGFRWREGIAFVHTEEPMSARAYRGVLVLPGLIQGVVPVLVGLILGNGWWTIYGFVMLASAVGDLAVLRLMRPLPGDALVRDHAGQVGCQVRVPA